MNFDPSVGGEIQKRRPAVIVSNNAANNFLNRIQVVPLTPSVGRVFPSEALVTVNGRLGKAMADQLTTVSKERVGDRIGSLSPDDMRKVEFSVRIQLGLAVTGE